MNSKRFTAVALSLVCGAALAADPDPVVAEAGAWAVRELAA